MYLVKQFWHFDRQFKLTQKIEFISTIHNFVWWIYFFLFIFLLYLLLFCIDNSSFFLSRNQFCMFSCQRFLSRLVDSLCFISLSLCFVSVSLWFVSLSLPVVLLCRWFLYSFLSYYIYSFWLFILLKRVEMPPLSTFFTLSNSITK